MWQSTFPPRGKQESQVSFLVLRGKWHEVPKRERPLPRRKVALSVAKRRMRSHVLKHDASSTANAVPLPQPGKAKLGLEIIRGGSKPPPYTYLRLSIHKRRSMPKRYSPYIITNRNRATRDFISVQPRFLLALSKIYPPQAISFFAKQKSHPPG